MATTTNKILISVEVPGAKEMIATINKLDQEIAQLQETREKNKGLTTQELAQMQSLKKERALEINALARLRSAMTASDDSIITQRKQLAALTDAYNRQKDKTSELAISIQREAKRISDSLKQQEQAIGDHRRSVGNYEKVWDGLKNRFPLFAGAAGLATVAITAISSAISTGVEKIKEYFASYGKLSDELANVAKTNNLTMEQALELNERLAKIDTRTSMENLRKIAAVAGQLGISNKDVLGFTEAVDKLNVSLGSEIKGGAEEVATVIGKLRNVLQDTQTKDVSADLMHLGNALNVLGKAGFATADIVADFANRIGGIAIPLGMTSGQVLGISATLQELNVNVERGGTAIGRILQKMTTNTDEFAKIAGMNIKDFSKLVNTDLYGAFLKTIEGSKKSGENAILLANVIKDLEIQGIGATEVFMKFGSNMDMLKEKVKLSTDSLKGNSSILEEFDKKNNNLAGSIEKIWKTVEHSFQSSIMFDLLTKFAKGISDIIAPTNLLSDKLKDEQAELTKLVTVIRLQNQGSEKRLALVKELSEKYPELTKNIDLNKVSNDELNKILAKGNDEYKKRIALALTEEVVIKEQMKLKDLLREKFEIENKWADIAARKRTSTGLEIQADQRRMKELEQLIKEQEKNIQDAQKRVEDFLNKNLDMRKNNDDGKKKIEKSAREHEVKEKKEKEKEELNWTLFYNHELKTRLDNIEDFDKARKDSAEKAEKEIRERREKELDKDWQAVQRSVEREKKYKEDQIRRINEIVASYNLEQQEQKIRLEESELMRFATTEEEKAAISRNTEERIYQTRVAYYEKYLSAIQQGASAINSISKNAMEIESINQQIAYTDDQKALDDKLKKRLISQAQYESQKKQLDEKAAQDEKELKKKYAGIDMFMKMLSITADGAKGIASIWGSWAWNPAVAIPLTAVEAASIISQYALANAQYQQIMALATGGVVPGTGTGDTVPAMLTPGEVVLNERQQNIIGKGAIYSTLSSTGGKMGGSYFQDGGLAVNSSVKSIPPARSINGKPIYLALDDFHKAQNYVEIIQNRASI